MIYRLRIPARQNESMEVKMRIFKWNADFAMTYVETTDDGF